MLSQKYSDSMKYAGLCPNPDREMLLIVQAIDEHKELTKTKSKRLVIKLFDDFSMNFGYIFLAKKHH